MACQANYIRQTDGLRNIVVMKIVNETANKQQTD